SLRLWDAASGREVRRLGDYPRGVHGLAYSPDGALLAVSDDRGWVDVWHIATGRRAGRVGGPTLEPRSQILFTAGNRLLVNAADAQVLLLDVPSGRRLRTFP